MAELDFRLKASTLMESLIAMVILVLCLGIATMIYSTVLTSDRERKQLTASMIANEEVIRVKAEKDFLDSEYEVNGYIIKKEVEKYEQTENLYLLSIVVLNAERKTIYTRKELLIIEG
jgi:Tfp pilus assembly protein PilV